MKMKLFFSVLIVIMLFTGIFAQTSESPLKVFGYFQNEFMYESCSSLNVKTSSFLMQQLNVLFQKDLSFSWTAFVNFEFVNSYSSFHKWGAMNLEEAWIKYRLNNKFNLKLGLQIPIFNNLNEINNRTPLLPYIIRPLAYETSFREFIAVEELVPARAFAQTYGFLPINQIKLDYAAYIGNSPNINNLTGHGQTGVDTTATALVGGRVGIRLKEFKMGLSATKDYVNTFSYSQRYLGGMLVEDEEMSRTRLGSDLSFEIGKFSLESEFILVDYDEDFEDIEFDKKFYYGTLGYRITEKLFLYGSNWVTEETFTIVEVVEEEPKSKYLIDHGDIDIIVPNFGIAYNLNDKITFKGQIAQAQIKSDNQQLVPDQKTSYFSLAVSVMF